MPYTYRNINTGDVYTFGERDKRLDALNNWELVEGGELHDRTEETIDRLKAQQESIRAAALHRLDTPRSIAEAPEDAGGSHPAQTYYSGLPDVPVPTDTVLARKDAGQLPSQAMTRAEHEERARWEEENPPRTGVLARAKADQREGLTQVGPVGDARRKTAAKSRRKADKQDAGVEPATTGGKSVEAPEE